MPTILLKSGIGPPGALLNKEPAVETTPGAPKLWVGIGVIPTVLADPARLAALEARLALLEARVVVLEGCIWGIP